MLRLRIVVGLADVVDRACGHFRFIEPRQQRQRGLNRRLVWSLEPFETPRVAAPGNDVEDGGGEIDAVNLWLAVWAKPIARIP